MDLGPGHDGWRWIQLLELGRDVEVVGESVRVRCGWRNKKG
jgi:hypothetical protein